MDLVPNLRAVNYHLKISPHPTTMVRLQIGCIDRYDSVYTVDANAPGGRAISLEIKGLKSRLMLGLLVPKQGTARLSARGVPTNLCLQLTPLEIR